MLKQCTWLAAMVLIGGLLAACHTYDSGATRQEGDLDTQSPDEINRNPYPAVLGDTTGGGEPRDSRTGGGVSGTDVTPRERFEPGRSPGDRPATTPPAQVPGDAAGPGSGEHNTGAGAPTPAR